MLLNADRACNGCRNTGECVQRVDMPEDWLAIVIRKALQSSVGNAEPPPENWDRIRQNIEAMALSLSH